MRYTIDDVWKPRSTMQPTGMAVAGDKARYLDAIADVTLAEQTAAEKIAEWDRDADPHGWWHDRSMLIALLNEIEQLRSLVRRDALGAARAKET